MDVVSGASDPALLVEPEPEPEPAVSVSLPPVSPLQPAPTQEPEPELTPVVTPKKPRKSRAKPKPEPAQPVVAGLEATTTLLRGLSKKARVALLTDAYLADSIAEEMYAGKANKLIFYDDVRHTKKRKAAKKCGAPKGGFPLAAAPVVCTGTAPDRTRFRISDVDRIALMRNREAAKGWCSVEPVLPVGPAPHPPTTPVVPVEQARPAAPVWDPMFGWSTPIATDPRRCAPAPRTPAPRPVAAAAEALRKKILSGR
jgi:hypothetical protein